jgi:hypothetical protein
MISRYARKGDGGETYNFLPLFISLAGVRVWETVETFRPLDMDFLVFLVRGTLFVFDLDIVREGGHGGRGEVG